MSTSLESAAIRHWLIQAYLNDINLLDHISTIVPVNNQCITEELSRNYLTFSRFSLRRQLVDHIQNEDGLTKEKAFLRLQEVTK